MKQLLQQITLLSFSFLFIFLWQVSPLSKYTLQISLLLVALYLVRAIMKRKFNTIESATHDGWSIFFLNTICILLIFATGVFSSSLFFLLYFLPFGIAFVFEPITVLVYGIGIVLVFLQYLFTDDTVGNILHLAPFIFIIPLSFYFGRDYKKREAEAVLTKEEKEKTKKKR